MLAGTSGRSFLPCLMAARHPRYSVDKCATRLYFFFAAGAITFCQRTGNHFHNHHPFEREDIHLLKVLVLPYYRITIWVKNKRKPLQGIRQIDQYNIDLVFNMIKKTAHSKINSSLIQDIEVAMLPKNSTAVINHLNRLHKKNP